MEAVEPALIGGSRDGLDLGLEAEVGRRTIVGVDLELLDHRVRAVAQRSDKVGVRQRSGEHAIRRPRTGRSSRAARTTTFFGAFGLHPLTGRQREHQMAVIRWQAGTIPAYTEGSAGRETSATGPPTVGEETVVSAEQNIETVKAMYEAFGRGDVEAILERCTDDVDWAAEAAIEVAPWHGVKRGKAEVPSFFAGIAQTGPVTEFSPLSFTSNDDGDVMVFIRYAFTVTATGKDVAMNLHHYWRFRDGKVAYVRSAEDTALIAAALSG